MAGSPSIRVVQPEAGTIVVLDSDPSAFHVRWAPAAGYELVRWEIFCHQCGTVRSTTSLTAPAFDIQSIFDGGHPGPFDVRLVLRETPPPRYVVYVTTSSSPANGGSTIYPVTELVYASDSRPSRWDDSIDLVATPAPGFRFVRWTDEDDPSWSSASQTTTINLYDLTEFNDVRKRYVAHFEAYTQTVHIDFMVFGNGTCNPSGDYPASTSLTLDALPAAGWRFSAWEIPRPGGGSDVVREPRHVITVDPTFVAMTIICVFERDPTNLIVYDDESGQLLYDGTSNQLIYDGD